MEWRNLHAESLFFWRNWDQLGPGGSCPRAFGHGCLGALCRKAQAGCWAAWHQKSQRYTEIGGDRARSVAGNSWVWRVHLQMDAHCVMGFAMRFGCRTVCDIRFSDTASLSIFREDTVDLANETIHHDSSLRLTSASPRNAGSHLKSRPRQRMPSGISFLWDTSWELQRREILKIFRTKIRKRRFLLMSTTISKQEIDSNWASLPRITRLCKKTCISIANWSLAAWHQSLRHRSFAVNSRNQAGENALHDTDSYSTILCNSL